MHPDLPSPCLTCLLTMPPLLSLALATSGDPSQVVLLAPTEPTDAFRALLISYPQRLHYLNGDVLVPADLHRTRLDSALGCFFLADPNAACAKETDAVTLLRAIAVHNFRPQLRTIVQLLDPRHKAHLMAVGFGEHNIICREELQMSLAAQGALLPGLSALLSNLVTSIHPHVTEEASMPGGEWIAECVPSRRLTPHAARPRPSPTKLCRLPRPSARASACHAPAASILAAPARAPWHDS